MTDNVFHNGNYKANFDNKVVDIGGWNTNGGHVDTVQNRPTRENILEKDSFNGGTDMNIVSEDVINGTVNGYHNSFIKGLVQNF